MLKKIEVDAAQADLAAVEALLGRRTRQSDPIGWQQFSKRRQELKDRVAELKNQISHSASVALFFGGLPVLGSRGIKADFGTKAIEQFQDIIKKRFAEYQGPIGSRGPTKQADQTAMIITDVARGSFGFVLEETQDQHFADSNLKVVVEDVMDLISSSIAPNDDVFDALLESVDPRVLSSLRTFFNHLDNEGATLRIVEDDRELSLPREAITRARNRTDKIEITEETRDFEGKLFVLPESRKFDLISRDGSSIRGSVAADFFKSLSTSDNDTPDLSSLIGADTDVLVRVRAVQSPNAAIRYAYRLISISNGSSRQDDASGLFGDG